MAWHARSPVLLNAIWVTNSMSEVQQSNPGNTAQVQACGVQHLPWHRPAAWHTCGRWRPGGCAQCMARAGRLGTALPWRCRCPSLTAGPKVAEQRLRVLLQAAAAGSGGWRRFDGRQACRTVRRGWRKPRGGPAFGDHTAPRLERAQLALGRLCSQRATRSAAAASS